MYPRNFIFQPSTFEGYVSFFFGGGGHLILSMLVLIFFKGFCNKDPRWFLAFAHVQRDHLTVSGVHCNHHPLKLVVQMGIFMNPHFPG